MESHRLHVAKVRQATSIHKEAPIGLARRKIGSSAFPLDTLRSRFLAPIQSSRTGGEEGEEVAFPDQIILFLRCAEF